MCQLLRATPLTSTSTPSACTPAASMSRASQLGQPLPALMATTLVQAAAISHQDYRDNLLTVSCAFTSPPTVCSLQVRSCHRPAQILQRLLLTLRVTSQCEPGPQNLTLSGLLSNPGFHHSPAACTLPSVLFHKWAKCVPRSGPLYLWFPLAGKLFPLCFCGLLHHFIRVLFKY